MASTGFKAPRRHNRRFPGKLGARPDFSKDRRLGALARHEASLGVNMTITGETAIKRQERITKCIEGTRKNLGMDL